jgi:hypothetical protein
VCVTCHMGMSVHGYELHAVSSRFASLLSVVLVQLIR